MKRQATTKTPVVIAVLLLASGCGGGAGGQGAASCPRPTPVENVAALPPGLGPEVLGTVTEVARKHGYVNVTATADGEVREVQQRFTRAVERAGYAVVGSENEVVEADVFFAGAGDATGAAKFIQTRCTGRVRVHLFVKESGV